MSSIVKIAKIAPSASIVYQFLVFFRQGFAASLMKVVSKRVKSDWSINPVVHIGNTANHWYAKNITNFKCPNIICSKFDNTLPPQLSTTWGQKSFSSSLVSLSKSVLWSGPDTSKYEAQIQYSNKWGPAVIHPTETIKPHKKISKS